MVRFFDITDEAMPLGVSTWTVHEGAEDFCAHGGRFGTHSSNENMTPIYYDRVLFIAHFNAGVRAIDVRDPFFPKEIAYFVPPITDKTDKRCVGTGAEQHCKIAIQTNNVEVDDRGYIYIVDRANTGMDILELSGEARAIAHSRAPPLRCHEPGQRRQCTVGMFEASALAVAAASLRACLSRSS